MEEKNINQDLFSDIKLDIAKINKLIELIKKMINMLENTNNSFKDLKTQYETSLKFLITGKKNVGVTVTTLLILNLSIRIKFEYMNQKLIGEDIYYNDEMINIFSNNISKFCKNNFYYNEDKYIYELIYKYNDVNSSFKKIKKVYPWFSLPSDNNLKLFSEYINIKKIKSENRSMLNDSDDFENNTNPKDTQVDDDDEIVEDIDITEENIRKAVMKLHELIAREDAISYNRLIEEEETDKYGGGKFKNIFIQFILG